MKKKSVSKKAKKLTLQDLKKTRGGKADCSSGLVGASTQEAEAKSPELQAKVTAAYAPALDGFAKSNGM